MVGHLGKEYCVRSQHYIGGDTIEEGSRVRVEVSVSLCTGRHGERSELVVSGHSVEGG